MIDKGTANKDAFNFIKTIQNKKVAYFFTLGAFPNSKHAKDCIKNIDQLFLDNKNTPIGNFHCQGAIDPKLISWMSELSSDHPHSPNEERIKRWSEASKHPNKEDLENAYNYFNELI